MTDLILISHNSKKDLERFLPSIAKYTKDYTLTIIDNGSDKETKKFLKKLDSNIIKVIFQENTGYSSAINTGARTTSNDVMVFLNCDLSATEGWLDKLLEPLKDEKIAVSGAKMFSSNGSEFPTPATDWVLGACMAIKREQLNLFTLY